VWQRFRFSVPAVISPDFGDSPSAAQAHSLAVVSPIGDTMSVITYEPAAGSAIDKYRHETVEPMRRAQP
jgi:hypothetical protein